MNESDLVPTGLYSGSVRRCDYDTCYLCTICISSRIRLRNLHEGIISRFACILYMFDLFVLTTYSYNQSRYLVT